MLLDPVLVFGAAAILGGYVVAAPWPVVSAAFALGLMLAPRLGARMSVVASVALVAGATRATSVVPTYEAELYAARSAIGAPRRCSGQARVETQPALRDQALGYVAAFESLDCEGRIVPRVRVRLREGPPLLARGDLVDIVAQLAPAELFRNTELSDPTPGAARGGVTLSGAALSVRVVQAARGPAALVDRMRARVRARIEATFVPEAAPMARALVLGENDLTSDDSAAFRASGLSHLLAVSGTHLVFAVLGVVRALAFVLARVERLAARWDVGRFAAGFGALLAPAYADFAGGSGSARRAGWMLAIALSARAAGRRPCAVRSFALSLVLGALVDPLIGFDASFILSAAATAGLLALGAPLARRLARPGARPLWRWLVVSVAATVSAMLPCTPILATLGPTLTLAGIAANVAAAPFGEMISLPLCLVHAVVPAGAAERGIALVASGALLVVRWLARVSASAGWLAIAVPPPGAWHFAVLGVGIVGLLTGSAGSAVLQRAWSIGTAGALLLIEGAAFRAGHPRGVLRVTVLDVGQGDSALVDLPDGSLMLVDGGGFVGSPVDPGALVILPVLRARRRNRIDVALLTHPHPDHFLGLATVLRSTAIGELWDTGQGREQGAGTEYAAMIDDLTKKHVPIRGPDRLCGPARKLGGALVRVLAPCPAFDPLLGPNDNSFVVKLSHGERRVLLTGDAEHEAEARLLASSGSELSADLLKVGHHGSRTSTSPSLLDAVHPWISTISCGARNRFGHPHPDTLSALRWAGVVALRTDVVGSVEFRTDGRYATSRVFGASFRERKLAELW